MPAPIRSRAAAGWPWPLRAIQLDVARHLESVTYIRRFTDDAARLGFNTLVLYLEGRVRTPTFPFRPKDASYSLEDMAAVVGHARKAGLEVVPVVSTLGHAEQFLTCRELTHLAEERDGRGRFRNPTPFVFCPSKEETYAFFDAYFRELAQVFTGPYWHTGLDEATNLGYCPLCRERWEKDGLGALFAEHVRRSERLVRALGKRMWMWDDFFELFPEQLERIPKAVVQCHWGYDDRIEPEGQQAHFVNRWRRDWLALYERLGIEAIVCPWSNYPSNVETFTDYGRRHRVLGGLLTQWEGTPRLRPGHPVEVAFAGRLWSAPAFDPEQAWRSALRAVLPRATPALARAVRGLVCAPACAESFEGPALAGWTRDDSLQSAVAELGLDLLRTERARQPKAAGAALLDSLEFEAEKNSLRWAARRLALDLVRPDRPASDAPRLARRLADCRRQLARVRRLWRAYARRRADAHNPQDRELGRRWDAWQAGLDALETRLRRPASDRQWLLILRLLLQDYYGAPQLKVGVQTGGRWKTAAAGCFKPMTLLRGGAGGAYTVFVPLELQRPPTALRLEAWGYGGQGVAFAELRSRSGARVPGSILRVSGPVQRPEAALRDDSAVALLGCTDILAAMHRPHLAEQPAVLELGLRPGDRPRIVSAGVS